MRLRKLFIIFFSVLLVWATNAKAATEKECFEKVSRGIFKFNQGFDNLLLEPAAKLYNKLFQVYRIASTFKTMPPSMY